MNGHAETWKPVPGYEGAYEASDAGRVKSLPRLDSRGISVRGRILSQHSHPSGHMKVKLSKPGKQRSASVHRIVALAFLGPQPEGHEVCHNDGDPANNNVNNLRWGTRSENLRDRTRHGIHHQAIKTHCPQGHEYTPGNTYRKKTDNARMCRQCLRDRNAETRARLKRMEEAA